MKYLLTAITAIFFTTAAMADDDERTTHLALSLPLGYAAESWIHDKYDVRSDRIVLGAVLGTLPTIARELTQDEFDNKNVGVALAGAVIGSYFADKNNTVMPTVALIEGKVMLGVSGTY